MRPVLQQGVFLTARRIRIGKLSEIPPGSYIEKRFFARRVTVFNVNGSLYGMDAECRHMKASLSCGKIDDGIITCPWHGWKYRLKDGLCLKVEGMDLKTYEVEVEGDEVYLLFSS